MAGPSNANIQGDAPDGRRRKRLPTFARHPLGQFRRPTLAQIVQAPFADHALRLQQTGEAPAATANLQHPGEAERMLPLQHRQEVRTDPLLRGRMLIIGPCGSREALTDSFCFYCLPVRPPTVPQGTSRIRFSLTAAIQPEEIDRLIQVIGEERS